MGLGWAEVGKQCICVTGATPTCQGSRLLGTGPKAGNKYTITEIRIGKVTGMTLLVFSEIPDYGGNSGWNVASFRPLVTKTLEQDMEAFNHLLNPTPLERLDRLAELLDIR